ncbi:helix-turn-helix domain-containing protein [Actinophytocola sp.]|uniref:helix-turn-helix domain-containing protein n=1 Tax=Actinophytocola sp. TaxID=1872138 RepID=UPI003899F4F4
MHVAIVPGPAVNGTPSRVNFGCRARVSAVGRLTLSGMNDRHTTTRSRQLGTELKRVRERAGFSARDLARALGWSDSKVSRMENGQRGASEIAVATYLAYFHVVGDEMDRLIGMCREIWAKDWLQPHGEHIPEELRTLVTHETTATLINQYEPLVIPGLLQTEGYATALFRLAGRIPAEGIEPRIQARMERQNVLRREHGIEINFFIPEQVLRAIVGGPRVMNDQLLHIVLVSARSWCTVRVVPSSFPPGALGSPFQLMDYPNHPPVAYVENQTHSLFLENPKDVGTYRAILRKLKEVTLNEGESRELLASLANEYDVPEAEDGVAEE